MKKTALFLILFSSLVACQKETTSPTTSPTNNDVTISSFNCAGVKITGTLTKDKMASNITATINYTGGNGKTYLTKSHTSTGVSGLSATLLAGSLANGEGELVYTISGTPTSSGTANFAIALGGQTCAITMNVEDVAQTIGKPGPNITDAESNSYKTVYIGTQQWMAENLKVSKYSDGTTIPNITDNTQWQNNTTGAWAYFNNDAANNAKYGKLYNWYAVSKTSNGNKNVCPTGWHVPTDAEWTVLTDYLGGYTVGFDTSLFTGLKGGYRDYNGNYYFRGSYAVWWSSTMGKTVDIWNRNKFYASGGANRDDYSKKHGLSVRCLRD